jgi:hypothetical protein
VPIALHPLACMGLGSSCGEHTVKHCFVHF